MDLTAARVIQRTGVAVFTFEAEGGRLALILAAALPGHVLDEKRKGAHETLDVRLVHPATARRLRVVAGEVFAAIHAGALNPKLTRE